MSIDINTNTHPILVKTIMAPKNWTTKIAK